MRQALTALIAMTCFIACAWQPAQAQVPKTVSVGFVNKTEMNVHVKGYTIVNGVQRGGAIFQVEKSGGLGFESNVPNGVRYYTVYDTNFKILLRDHAAPVQNRNLSLLIVPVPGQPNRVMIVAGP